MPFLKFHLKVRQSFRNVKYLSSCGLVTVLGVSLYWCIKMEWGEDNHFEDIVRVWLGEREWLHEPFSMLSENGPKYVDNNSGCAMVGIVVWLYSRMTVR